MVFLMCGDKILTDADGILTRLAVRRLRNVLGTDYEKIPVPGKQI